MKRKLDIGSGGGGEDEPSINPWTGKTFSSRYYDILKVRQKLPVFEFKAELERKVRENQVVVVEGETGSGKVSNFLLVVLFVWA